MLTVNSPASTYARIAPRPSAAVQAFDSVERNRNNNEPSPARTYEALLPDAIASIVDRFGMDSAPQPEDNTDLHTLKALNAYNQNQQQFVKMQVSEIISSIDVYA